MFKSIKTRIAYAAADWKQSLRGPGSSRKTIPNPYADMSTQELIDEVRARAANATIDLAVASSITRLGRDIMSVERKAQQLLVDVEFNSITKGI